MRELLNRESVGGTAGPLARGANFIIKDGEVLFGNTQDFPFEIQKNIQNYERGIIREKLNKKYEHISYELADTGDKLSPENEQKIDRIITEAEAVLERRIATREPGDIWTVEKRLQMDTERFGSRIAPAPVPIVEPGATVEGKQIFRGSGREKAETVYNEMTDGKPLLEGGQFWALSEKDAKTYGPNIETKPMPKFINPLVIKNDGEWTALVQKAVGQYDTRGERVSYPNPYGMNPEKMALWRKGISDYLSTNNHDALIVDMEEAQGDEAKTLGNAFGHSQVFIPGQPGATVEAKPSKEAYVGKEETGTLPIAIPFNLTAPEGEVGREVVTGREVTGELFGKAEAKEPVKASFAEMVTEAQRWRGAAVKVDQALGDDKKARLAHSNMTTKGDLDAYLMKKYGLDSSLARDVSNQLTRDDLKPDMTAEIEDFKGEPWADKALVAPSEWLNYDPSTNRYNGEVLSRGDILEADAGGRYAVDRVNGFMLDLTRLDVAGKPSGTFSVSVDPMDKGRFAKLKKTGENIYKAEPTARKDELTPIQSYFENNVVRPLKDFFAAVDSMGRERLVKAGVMPDENATKWLASVMRQESSWAKGGRKTGITGIQMLSQKGLWPTKDEAGENLRKSMLAAVQALRKAPGYSNDWVSNIEKGAYAFGETKGETNVQPD
ncbi:MAG: hypothetical protein ABIJ26_01550, partial [Candidatus Margulisiibacteriota bacterium]